MFIALLLGDFKGFRSSVPGMEDQVYVSYHKQQHYKAFPSLSVPDQTPLLCALRAPVTLLQSTLHTWTTRLLAAPPDNSLPAFNLLSSDSVIRYPSLLPSPQPCVTPPHFSVILAPRSPSSRPHWSCLDSQSSQYTCGWSCQLTSRSFELFSPLIQPLQLSVKVSFILDSNPSAIFVSRTSVSASDPPTQPHWPSPCTQSPSPASVSRGTFCLPMCHKMYLVAMFLFALRLIRTQAS